MNLPETANLLTSMSAYDQRTIGESDVIAWQAVLSDAPFEDCVEAVKRHYAEQTDRMMPAHVRRLVRDIRREREMAARATGWAPGQAGVPKDQAMPELTRDAMDDMIARMPSEMRAFLEDLAVKRGIKGPETLHPRQAYWEQEHKAFLRSQGGEPNPLYKPVPPQLCPAGIPSRYDHDHGDVVRHDDGSFCNHWAEG